MDVRPNLADPQKPPERSHDRPRRLAGDSPTGVVWPDEIGDPRHPIVGDLRSAEADRLSRGDHPHHPSQPHRMAVDGTPRPPGGEALPDPLLAPRSAPLAHPRAEPLVGEHGEEVVALVDRQGYEPQTGGVEDQGEVGGEIDHWPRLARRSPSG